jgi:hypothetical protein
VAAFGLYGARHLAVPGDEERPVPASESWWSAPAAQVAVSLRQLGSRATRGRMASVEDHRLQKERLRRQAEDAAMRRMDAAAELRSAGERLEQARLSPEAMRLLLDLLARALAAGTPALTGARAADLDLDLGLVLTRVPGQRTVLRSADGDLGIDDAALVVGRLGEMERLVAREWSA